MAGEAAAGRAQKRLAREVAELYLKTRVMTAEPTKLVLELYGAAIAGLERAIAALAGGTDAGAAVGRVIHVLCELELYLDFERSPDLSTRLASVYEHLEGILTEECVDPNRATLEEVVTDLRILRDAWREVWRRSR